MVTGDNYYRLLLLERPVHLGQFLENVSQILKSEVCLAVIPSSENSIPLEKCPV